MSKIKNEESKKEVKESKKEVIDETITDPEWAKTSSVDPKTGMHISQWRQEQLRLKAQSERT